MQSEWTQIILEIAAKNGGAFLLLLFGGVTGAGLVLKMKLPRADSVALPPPAVSKGEHDELRYRHDELERRHNALRDDHEKLEARVADVRQDVAMMRGRLEAK